MFELTILRCGNGIGFPLTHEVDIWHNFVNDLCVQAVKHRELIIKSPPNIERNFVTLEDFCRAFYFFGIERLNSTGHRVFNLGSKMSRTLLEMAELIASQTQSLFGFRPTIRLESEPSRHETRLVYDSRRLETTGFQLNESFEKEISGILRFVSETNV